MTLIKRKFQLKDTNRSNTQKYNNSKNFSFFYTYFMLCYSVLPSFHFSIDVNDSVYFPSQNYVNICAKKYYNNMIKLYYQQTSCEKVRKKLIRTGNYLFQSITIYTWEIQNPRLGFQVKFKDLWAVKRIHSFHMLKVISIQIQKIQFSLFLSTLLTVV